MGKKGKRHDKLIRNSNVSETVSILTPTVSSRQHFLHILAECITNQTYFSKIKQWVIVSADKSWSQNQLDSTVLSILNKFPILKTISINAVHITHSLVIQNKWELCDSSSTTNNQQCQVNYENIGYLRNITNLLATSEYLICMDDDDYYPPMRVESAVTALRNSHKLIAGCSNMIAYETDLQQIYQFKKFGNNHSVNNCLAYKKQYILNGALYDSTRKHAEERSFLKDYTVEMIQLDPSKTVVQMIHSHNTYNKRQLIVRSEWSEPIHQSIQKISNNLYLFIPKHFLDMYSKLLQIDINPTLSEYDIVYYLGTNGIQWSPYDNNLGGSEQAVKYLVEHWTKLGLSVCVYGDFTNTTIELTAADPSTGNYLNYMDFKCNKQYNTLILWRNYGIHPLLTWPVKAKQIIVDVHDIVPLVPSCFENIHKISKFLVKSEFHKKGILYNHKAFNHQLSEKIHIISNGVRVDEFTLTNNIIERDQYRFCWTSCYTRGLYQILLFLWPFIKHYEPKASFHIYYGMDQVTDKRFKEEMKQLLNQPGVFDHGRQNLDTIIREKYTSSFHLYFSNTSAETDCIAIRESACAGCIPILSEYNVFVERMGIHFPGNPDNKEDMKNVGIQIIELLKKPDKIQSIRDNIVNKETNWENISKKWNDSIFN